MIYPKHGWFGQHLAQILPIRSAPFALLFEGVFWRFRASGAGVWRFDHQACIEGNATFKRFKVRICSHIFGEKYVYGVLQRLTSRTSGCLPFTGQIYAELATPKFVWCDAMAHSIIQRTCKALDVYVTHELCNIRIVGINARHVHGYYFSTDGKDSPAGRTIFREPS